MLVSGYSFGSITISGTTYAKDVIVYTDRVHSPWWRKEGHLLQPEDLKDIIRSGISTIIIGTGYYGSMTVPQETIDFLTSQGIEARVDKTGKAVDIYNKTAAAVSAAAAFHLTC